MLTILNDPAGVTGRRRIEWGAGTVFEQIARAMPDGGGDAAVMWNGAEVNPLADERFNSPPRADDEVVVVQRPAGLDPATWALIASFVLAAYTYSLIPKPVDQPQQNNSPNNQLTAQTNIARAYQAIPDVYGYRRVWPDLIQPSTIEYVSNVKVITEWLCVSRGKGTVSDERYAETPIVDIDGWTWSTFAPAPTPNAYPEHNETTLTDVYEAFETADVNGQEIPDRVVAPGASSRVVSLSTDGSSTFTLSVVSDPAVDALVGLPSLRVRFYYLWMHEAGETTITETVLFDETCSVSSSSTSGGQATFVLTGTSSIPAGVTPAIEDISESATANRPATLYGGDPEPEVIGPFTLARHADQIWCNFAFLRGLVGTVQVRADWWAVDSANAPIAGTDGTADLTFTAGSFDQQFFTEKITPASGLRRYRIQFSRLTADLGNGADVCKLEEVYAVRYYATKTLPGVTVVKAVRRATAQAISGQELKFNLRWQRHVRTLSSTTLSASRNFARALVHLWAIHGNSVAEIDTATLAGINAALGEDSSLLRFDWSFDDANLSIGERLQAIANVARCVLWRDGTAWTLTRDEARATPGLQLDYRNLAAGGESAISYSAHMPASADGVELEFVEQVDQLRKDYVRLDISSGAVVAGTSANPKKIKLIGCATSAQALNRAHLEARKLLYQRTSVSDTALADAVAHGPGSLVRWIDPHDFYADDGLQGGEVLAISGSTITTSEPLQWGAETTGRIFFTDDEGGTIGPVVVTPLSGSQALLASVPGGLYVRDDTRQLGSRFAFGAGLSATEIAAAGLYTVTEIRPASDRTVAVSLVNYDARCYVMDTVQVLVVAAETDAAMQIRSNIAAVGIASEYDSARPLPILQARTLVVAEEDDAAISITVA